MKGWVLNPSLKSSSDSQRTQRFIQMVLHLHKVHYVPFKLWQPCRLWDLCTKVILLLLLYYNSISILAMGLLQILNSRNLWSIPMGSEVIYLSKIDRSAKWIHPSRLRNHNHHLAPRTYFHRLYKLIVGWDWSVGIATRYWLDGPGIESRWGRDFPHLSRPVLGPTQPPIQWVTEHFPRVKSLTPHSHLDSMLKKE